MATSAVPAAIDALITLWRAAPGLSNVRVIDGPPTQDMSGSELLAVGWSMAGEGNSADAAQDFNAAGARTRDENFDIACWVESWTGDSDIGPRRRRAYELLAVVEDTLRATASNPTAPTLGGVVQWAHLTSHTLQQSNDNGVRAGISFVITCRARI